MKREIYSTSVKGIYTATEGIFRVCSVLQAPPPLHGIMYECHDLKYKSLIYNLARMVPRAYKSLYANMGLIFRI